MRHEIAIDPENCQITVVISGPCTVEDMRTVQRAVAATPGFDPELAQLADFSAVENFNASVLDLIALARSAPFSRHATRAYVATPSWAFGMLRKFALAAETIGYGNVRVFNDPAKARAWLAERRASRIAAEAEKHAPVV